MKSLFACIAFFAPFFLGGCAEDSEDQNFYYRGWARPKMSPDDRAYFYGAKTKRGEGPEAPLLPTGKPSE